MASNYPRRTILAHFSTRGTGLAGRNMGRSFRPYSTGKTPRQKERFTVWRPYLRLVVGVPFIGAIIYSMVGQAMSPQITTNLTGLCQLGHW